MVLCKLVGIAGIIYSVYKVSKKEWNIKDYRTVAVAGTSLILVLDK